MVIAALAVVASAGTSRIDAQAAPETGTIEGRVVDDPTGELVPYVNVGIPRGAVGTVGGEDGSFALLGTLPGDAVILFSAIGYRTLDVPLIAFPAKGEVRLTPWPQRFQEQLTVTAKAGGDPTRFGKKLEARGNGFGFGSAYLGAEIGARIRIDGPTFVESANFTVAHTGGERFLFRVNLYDFAEGKLGENLLKRNVIVAARQNRGTLTVDLREQRLVVHDDVLLSLEWIQDDASVGNANVMFRARPRSKGNAYQKLTSQMEFREVERHTLGFFLMGSGLTLLH